MRTLSRLEKTLFRLQAQHACMDWLFEQIRNRPGVVAELGLGHGRTFDHLRRHLPERDIYVFDFANDAYADCQPDPDFLILGDIAETFPAALPRFAGRVALANSDIGSFDRERNVASAALASRLLPEAMAPGGFITLPLPPGAREGRYYLYQRPL